MKSVLSVLVAAAAVLGVVGPQDPPRQEKPVSETAPSSVTPFLWFEKDAETAARFYCTIFPGSKVVSASPQTVTVSLGGREFMLLNGGTHYRLTAAYSMFVHCKDQAEVDRVWARLLENGGKPTRCGWLVDRFGLSWQVIPQRLLELLGHADAEVRKRATEAMLKMEKLDVAELDRAAKG